MQTLGGLSFLPFPILLDLLDSELYTELEIIHEQTKNNSGLTDLYSKVSNASSLFKYILNNRYNILKLILPI